MAANMEIMSIFGLPPHLDVLVDCETNCETAPFVSAMWAFTLAGCTKRYLAERKGLPPMRGAC